jgi:hypothetical protein
MSRTLFILPLIPLISCLSAESAHADQRRFNLNSDSFSYIEEPLAFSIGVSTFSANAIIDQSINYDTTSDKDSYNTRAIGAVRWDTQLPNSWFVGMEYTGQFNRLASGDENKKYEDDFSVSLSDEWGTLSVGNVSDIVSQSTHRVHGTGNATLYNSGFIGALDETAAAYVVNLNSYTWSTVADAEGRFESGLTYHRNMEEHNIFWAARFIKGDTTENETAENVDDTALFGEHGETFGAGLTASYTYGSTLADLQIGYENVKTNAGNDRNDHAFVSLGLEHKVRRLTVSVQGSLGEYDNEDLRSAATGLRYDLARGMSLNLGLNYIYIESEDRLETTGSIRYEF